MECGCCKTDHNRPGQGLTRTPAGTNARLSARDITGRWMARWGISRLNFRVEPGLYYIGEPGRGSEVFISANYKMSFDLLRKNLKGIDAWIIVLDTRGINVWCAAGKGTFGTDELVRMIKETGIGKIVDHKRLIVPQLGAPGIAAHSVKKRTGFKVIFGPVKARDIDRFLMNKMKADPEMRRVTFTLMERLSLAPVELVRSIKYFLIVLGPVVLVSAITGKPPAELVLIELLVFTGAVICGTVLFPVLLPLLPSRSFVIKGWILGLIYILPVLLITPDPFAFRMINFILVPPLVSFLGYNFTGSAPFTSLSGVEKELKLSLPFYVISVLTGIILILIKIL